MSFTPVFAMPDHVRVGVRFGHDGMSALSPFYPQVRTLVDAAGNGSVVLIREVAIGLQPHLLPERCGSAYAASGPSGGAAQVMLLWAVSFGRRCSRYIRSTCSRVCVFAKRARKAVISCG
jgi:hypothetical protein